METLTRLLFIVLFGLCQFQCSSPSSNQTSNLRNENQALDTVDVGKTNPPEEVNTVRQEAADAEAIDKQEVDSENSRNYTGEPYILYERAPFEYPFAIVKSYYSPVLRRSHDPEGVALDTLKAFEQLEITYMAYTATGQWYYVDASDQRAGWIHENSITLFKEKSEDIDFYLKLIADSLNLESFEKVETSYSIFYKNTSGSNHYKVEYQADVGLLQVYLQVEGELEYDYQGTQAYRVMGKKLYYLGDFMYDSGLSGELINNYLLISHTSQWTEWIRIYDRNKQVELSEVRWRYTPIALKGLKEIHLKELTRKEFASGLRIETSKKDGKPIIEFKYQDN
ncbi:MAG: hypothetical protein ABJH72_03450 [Reichenbachiella sp.]|uniref:hypothetical protein n=1 Tax=Reichenbachiella sp. TaxID=2184521 RepID=UPI003264A9D8